jgi:cyanate permease
MAASLVLTVKNWDGWHLGLFVWGLGLVLAQVIYAIASARRALRLDPDVGEQRKASVRSRLRVSVIEVTIMGVGVAVAAGGTGWVAIDAGLTAIFLVAGGLSTFLGVRAIRR